MLLLLFAALLVDPRITFPYELTVTVQKDGKTYMHTEAYRNLELCEADQKQLDQISQLVPDISVSDCDYVGLV